MTRKRLAVSRVPKGVKRARAATSRGKKLAGRGPLTPRRSVVVFATDADEAPCNDKDSECTKACRKSVYVLREGRRATAKATSQPTTVLSVRWSSSVHAAWITDAVCRSCVIHARRCLALLKFTAAFDEACDWCVELVRYRLERFSLQAPVAPHICRCRTPSFFHASLLALRRPSACV